MSGANGETDRGLEATTVVDLWSRRVAASGGEPAFKHKVGATWQTLTWAEADRAAREIAAGLLAAGLAPGESVCLLSQTRLDWMLCDIGVLLAGGVPVPIYASNTPEQCMFILRDCGATMAIVEDAAQLEKVLSVRGELPAVRRIVHMTGDATLERADATGRTAVRLADVRRPDDASVQSLDELRAAGRAAAATAAPELAKRTATCTADTMFTIIYTSGTTGTPKGVVLSHQNLTSAVASACRAMTLYSQDEQLLFLPLAHVLGRELAWVAVQGGLCTWFAESIAKLKDNLGEVKPTYMAAVPRVFEKFHSGVQAALKAGSGLQRAIAGWALRVGAEVTEAMVAGRAPGWWLAFRRAIADRLVFSKMRKRLGLERCRFLVSGGAPLAAEIGLFFYGIGVLILEGYGLTETMAAAFLNRLDKLKFGTVGPALDIVQVKIADDGEVLMRGPSVFRQYYKNPAATAEAVDADGWFHSGDIGQLEDGCLRITDRKKDLIVTAGGKKVAPQPIENAIKARSPLISQVVVFGDARPYCVALVTLSEEAHKKLNAAATSDSAATIEGGAARAEIEKEIAAVNAGLAPYETVKTFAILAHDFTEASGELTPSLKVKRKVVVDRYRSVIEGLYKQSRPE